MVRQKMTRVSKKVFLVQGHQDVDKTGVLGLLVMRVMHRSGCCVAGSRQSLSTGTGRQRHLIKPEARNFGATS